MKAQISLKGFLFQDFSFRTSLVGSFIKLNLMNNISVTMHNLKTAAQNTSSIEKENSSKFQRTRSKRIITYFDFVLLRD